MEERKREKGQRGQKRLQERADQTTYTRVVLGATSKIKCGVSMPRIVMHKACFSTDVYTEL